MWPPVGTETWSRRIWCQKKKSFKCFVSLSFLCHFVYISPFNEYYIMLYLESRTISIGKIEGRGWWPIHTWPRLNSLIWIRQTAGLNLCHCKWGLWPSLCCGTVLGYHNFHLWPGTKCSWNLFWKPSYLMNWHFHLETSFIKSILACEQMTWEGGYISEEFWRNCI